ncbi:phage protein NinX family protein [Siccibacter colletis]|uniref:phage protein NinX family protein n=1 Tax=Siccibacter colletis TaxID=1505757 RepID=UPI0004E13CD5
MDYSKLSDQEVNGLVMDSISDGNQAYRGGDGSAIELLHQINTVEFGEHVEREEVYAKFDPCNNPADAWPIITENNISIILDNPSMPCATSNARDLFDCDDRIVSVAYEKPLRAAMIVFLMMQEDKLNAHE